VRNSEASRRLTAAERDLAGSMFGTAVDYDRVRIHRRCWWPLQPRNVTMAPDGDIWFHPEGGLWRADFGQAPPHLQALFIHEMTHVWQAQHGGRWYLPLMRHPFCRYAYRLKPGKPFAHYGIEQQAEIVQHAWMRRRGLPVPCDAPAAEHEALLPF